MDGEFALIATIKDRYSTHYVDDRLAPETTYKYMMKSFGQNGISENGAVAVASTTKLLDSVPFARAIYGLPERIKLIWRPHPDLRASSYIIERRSPDGSWSNRAEVKGRLSAEYIDSVASGKSYEYRIFVKTSSGDISKPSEILQAQTKNLPNGVVNLAATKDQPMKITITWDSYNTDDFNGYRIYSARNKFLPYTLLGETRDTIYTDLINSNGSTRYYKVTLVDKDGLESLKQDEPAMGKTLESPKAPVLNNATFNGTSVELSWSASDSRIIKYKVEKSQILGLVADGNFDNLTGNSLSDSAVEKGKTYYYRVYGIDEFGVTSSASNSISVEVK